MFLYLWMQNSHSIANFLCKLDVIKLAFWHISGHFSEAAHEKAWLSWKQNSVLWFMFSPCPEFQFPCHVPASDVSCDEQNEWCTVARWQWGWFIVWENRELSQNKHCLSFLLGTLQRWAESILFGFFQALGKHLNERSNMGLPGSPRVFKTILRCPGKACDLCKQAERGYSNSC
jgi:hypothetical protein